MVFPLKVLNLLPQNQLTMERSTVKFTTVEQYLASLDDATREPILKLREIIRQAAPQAEEVISYGMPAIKQNGMLVWYAAAKAHIGFYPSASPIKIFAAELAAYKTSKGAIQLPYDQKLPVTLIKKIVKLRVQENEEKKIAKGKK